MDDKPCRFFIISQRAINESNQLNKKIPIEASLKGFSIHAWNNYIQDNKVY